MKKIFNEVSSKKHLLNKSCIYSSSMEKVFKQYFNNDTKASFGYGFVVFKDLKGSDLIITYRMETIEIKKSYDKSKTITVNSFDCIDPSQVIQYFSFDQETLKDIFKVLLVIAFCIWEGKISFNFNEAPKFIFNYTTSEFSIYNPSGYSSKGEIRIHSSGFLVNGPKFQSIHFLEGYIFETIQLFKFRRITLEKFLVNACYLWFKD